MRELLFYKPTRKIIEVSMFSIAEENIFILHRNNDFGCMRSYPRSEFTVLPEIFVPGLTNDEEYFVLGDVLKHTFKRDNEILVKYYCLVSPIDSRYQKAEHTISLEEVGNIFEDSSLIEQLSSITKEKNYDEIQYIRRLIEMVQG